MMELENQTKESYLDIFQGMYTMWRNWEENETIKKLVNKTISILVVENNDALSYFHKVVDSIQINKHRKMDIKWNLPHFDLLLFFQWMHKTFHGFDLFFVWCLQLFFVVKPLKRPFSVCLIFLFNPTFYNIWASSVYMAY